MEKTIETLRKIETLSLGLSCAEYEDICEKDPVESFEIFGTDIDVYDDGSIYYEW